MKGIGSWTCVDAKDAEKQVSIKNDEGDQVIFRSVMIKINSSIVCDVFSVIMFSHFLIGLTGNSMFSLIKLYVRNPLQTPSTKPR